MKRLMTVAVACALAGTLFTGCAKSASSEQGSMSSTKGPITDSASSGFKASPEAAGAPLGDATRGAAIFTQNCAMCHGAKGAGGGIGPSLKNEKSRKDFAAAVAWIKDPKPPMPKLYPSPLGEKDVDDVAAYVESL